MRPIGYRASAVVVGLAMLVACAMLAGCGSAGVIEAEPEPRPSQPLSTKFLVFEDGSALEGVLELQQVNKDPNASPMAVAFELLNRSDDPCHFEYKVDWYDQYRMPVESAADVYTKRRIEAKERITIREAAPAPRAIEYRLKLREWKQ